jgi:hypothetical protein
VVPKIAERDLPFDVYRCDVNGDGSGMLFMSRDGVLHAYSKGLDMLFTERVEELPEYAAQAKRFGISETQLKNHTHCLAFSSDRTRLLVTIVDEAWCYEASREDRFGNCAFRSRKAGVKSFPSAPNVQA